MSDIIKTEAVVLSKINYGDTSSIVSLYTESDGKLSVIVKGGRSSKSKTGKIIDPLNHLQVIYYKKTSRELQILSDANLISHFVNIKENLDATKYSFAIIELIKTLSPENESNTKLFKGLLKILKMIDEKNEAPAFLFGRFLLFFLSELGYELSINKCVICGKNVTPDRSVGFDFQSGFICSDCFVSHTGFESITAELFELIYCLKTNKSTKKFNVDLMDRFNLLLERYLKFHVNDFKGIQSLQIYK